MDFSRLRTGETLAGISGIALIVIMFLPWFAGFGGIETETTQVAPGVEVNTPTSVDTDVDAWEALQDFDGFLLALAAVSGIGLAALTAAGRRVAPGGLQRGTVTAGLGMLAVLIVLWRMLANPGDLKVGIFLGLIAAAGIAAGALMALREDGVDALEAVPDRRAGSSGAARSKPKPARSAAAKSSGGSRAGGSAARRPAARKASSRAKGGGRSSGSGPKRGKG